MNNKFNHSIIQSLKSLNNKIIKSLNNKIINHRKISGFQDSHPVYKNIWE